MNQTTAMAEQQPRQTCPKRGERSKRHLRQTGRVSIAVCIYPCMYDYALYVLQEGGEKAKECQKIRNRELWLLVGEIWSHQKTQAGRLWKHSWRHQTERSFKLFILFFCGTSFFCFFGLFFLFFSLGKKTQKKKVPRAAGAPPRLIACPPSRAIGALFEALTRHSLLEFGSFGRSLAAGNAADCGLWEQVVSTSCCDQGEAQSLSEFQTARCLLFFVCFLFCLLLFIVFCFVFCFFWFFLGGWCFFGLFFVVFW